MLTEVLYSRILKSIILLSKVQKDIHILLNETMMIYIQITNQIKTDCLKVLTDEGINSARAQKVKNPSKALKIMKKLGGKIAIITGGNRGIGLATAQRFVAGVGLAAGVAVGGIMAYEFEKHVWEKVLEVLKKESAVQPTIESVNHYHDWDDWRTKLLCLSIVSSGDDRKKLTSKRTLFHSSPLLLLSVRLQFGQCRIRYYVISKCYIVILSYAHNQIRLTVCRIEDRRYLSI
jgi:hypothetical protein